jgi:penicillin amidase
MKLIKRILLVLLAIIILAVMIGCALIRNVSRKSLPDYNEDIRLAGLNHEVQVYRDKFAVPHVYARTENDLYTATGYLLAQDRLWQMDLLRRVTLGRLSEIFGEGFIDTDLLLRALRFSEKSEKILADIDEKHLAALQSFCSGVNQFITSNQKKLPFEFRLLGYKPEPWVPLHTLNLIGYMAWDLKAGWNELILDEIKNTVDSIRYKELLPDYSHYKSVVYPEYDTLLTLSAVKSKLFLIAEQLEKIGAEIFDASNNWAVSGKKSNTGKPILENDMHLGFNIPGIWYQMHQVVEGELNVTGLILPGAPLIICGHNEYIAWGMTNVYVDNLDFYMEKTNPEDSDKYEFDGEWKDFIIKKETIRTKKGNEIIKENRFTHHGPVVSKFKGIDNKVITMHWVGDELSNEISTVYLLNRASNWEEFKNALQTFKSVSQNVIYADINGNIGLYCAAGVPMRKRTEVFPLLPGWTDEYEWKGMLDFDKLPFNYNPESGFTGSANNKTVSENYPYHIGSWYALPHRMDRIREVLSSKEKYCVEDFIALQLDQKSKFAEKHLPLLLYATNKSNKKAGLEIKCYELLKEWDYVYDTEYIAPTIFETYYNILLRNIFSDELGDELYNRFLRAAKVMDHTILRIADNKESAWLDDISTAGIIESLSDITVRSFQDAVSVLEKKYGNDIEKWKWGNVHQLTLQHPLAKVNIINKIFRLNRGSYRVGGSFHTVSPYSYIRGKLFEVSHGASHRHIYTLDNWDKSLTVIPTGNSGIPASDHYCDQTEMYINGQYHEDYFSEELVKKNTEYKMLFIPAE